MANAIATAYVDLKIDTKGLQQGLNQVKTQLAASGAATGGMAASASALTASTTASAAAMGGMAASTSALSTGLTKIAGSANTATEAMSPLSIAYDKFKKMVEENGGPNFSMEQFKEHVSINGVMMSELSDKAVNMTNKVEGTGNAAGRAAKATKKLAVATSAAGNAAAASVSKWSALKTAFMGVWIEALAAAYAVKKIFDATAEVESLTNRFISIGKSAEEAKKHMQDLQEYTNKTRFDLASVAQASALLLRFTDGAMGGVESLKKIGDAADIANKPIDQVALQVGKLYAALAAGGEGGSEPLNVLRDMGVVSAKAVAKMKGLLKETGNEMKIITVLMNDFAEAEGTSARSAWTLWGSMSTLKDSFKGLAAGLGNVFSPAVKGFTWLLSGLAASIAWVIKQVDGLLTSLYPLLLGDTTPWWENVKDTAFGVKGTRAELKDPMKEGAFSASALEKAKVAQEALIVLQQSYQDRLLSFNMRRMSDEEKIASLTQSKGQYELIAHGYAMSSADELYAAKTKLLDIDQQIAQIEENSARNLESAHTSYKEKLTAFAMSRVDHTRQILILEIEIAKQIAIAANEASKSEEERLKAKEKLLDLDQQMLDVKKEEVRIFDNTQKSINAVKEKMAKERSDYGKGLGFTGKFVGGEEAIKFSQQVQHDAIKAEDDYNKKMEEYEKEKLKIMKEYNARGGRTAENTGKIYDKIQSGELVIV